MAVKKNSYEKAAVIWGIPIVPNHKRTFFIKFDLIQNVNTDESIFGVIVNKMSSPPKWTLFVFLRGFLR